MHFDVPDFESTEKRKRKAKTFELSRFQKMSSCGYFIEVLITCEMQGDRSSGWVNDAFQA